MGLCRFRLLVGWLRARTGHQLPRSGRKPKKLPPAHNKGIRGYRADDLVLRQDREVTVDAPVRPGG